VECFVRNQNVELGSAGRATRFVPGWWILPGLVVSAATWAGAIWLIVRHGA
jgi:hypothetical protein